MSDDDNPAALRERVREQHARIEALEQTVADLQADPPTSTRRSILASAAAAAGLGSLGTYGVQQASAQASGPAGQVGTASEPVDVQAWDLDVQNGATFNGTDVTGVGSLGVEEASIGEIGGVAHLTADQTVSSGAVTSVEFNKIVVEDSVVQWDGTDYEWVIQEDGWYLFKSTVTFGNWVAGSRYQYSIRGNGDTTGGRAEDEDHQGDSKFAVPFGTIEPLSSGDQLGLEVFQDTGQDQTLLSGSIQNNLIVARLG